MAALPHLVTWLDSYSCLLPGILFIASRLWLMLNVWSAAINIFNYCARRTPADCPPSLQALGISSVLRALKTRCKVRLLPSFLPPSSLTCLERMPLFLPFMHLILLLSTLHIMLFILILILILLTAPPPPPGHFTSQQLPPQNNF